MWSYAWSRSPASSFSCTLQGTIPVKKVIDGDPPTFPIGLLKLRVDLLALLLGVAVVEKQKVQLAQHPRE